MFHRYGEQQKCSYFDIKSFKWTEREYTLKEIVEEYADCMPFVILVTEGYSSSRIEITSDEIYWIHEVTTQPCIVVRDSRNRYFSIPESYQEKVTPLKEVANGRFQRAGKSVSLREIRKMENCKFFSLTGYASKEVFDGAQESELIKLGRLEIVDTYEEKLLVGHPILSKPYVDLLDTRRPHEMKFTGAIYHQVTLIPVHLPIIVVVAVAMNEKSDHKFFKAMLELREFANICDHNYTPLMEEDAEIMVFHQAPVDKVYDYIRLMPLMKKKGDGEAKETKDKMMYSTVDEDEDEDSSSDYEQVDDLQYEDVSEVNHLKYRTEPIAFTNEMYPLERLLMLQEVYETGVLPPDTDPEEPPVPEKPPDLVPSEPGPPVPPRRKGFNLSKMASPPPPPPPPPPPLPGEGKQPSIKTATPKPSPRPPGGVLKSSAETRTSQKKKQPPPVPTKVKHPPPYINQGLLKDNKTDNESKAAPTANIYQLDNKVSRSTSIASEPRSPVGETKPKSPKITSVADIPDDISKLSVTSILECLHVLNMSEHVPAFKRSLVDGELLCHLQENVLKETFGLSEFDATKLVRFCKGWRPKIE